LDYLPVVLA